MNEIANITDRVAGQSDRWLAVASILMLLLVVAAIWRWMAADRDKISRRLTEITDRHIQSQEKLSEVVTNNTHALREVKDVMSYCRSSKIP